MGFRGVLGRWLLGGQVDFTDYTDFRLQEGLVKTLADDEPATQAVENAVMFVAQTAARCAVTVGGNLGDAWKGIVRPGRFMAVLMRDLMMHGNAVFEIEDPPDLKRVSCFEVYGKRSIRYRVTHAYPDGEMVRNLPSDAVCHILINSHRDSPWMGCSPFEKSMIHWAQEDRLIDQARLPSKRYISSPTPETSAVANETDHNQQRSALTANANEAGTEFVFSSGPRDVDQAIKHVDLTFSPSREAVELRGQLINEVWEAIGVPPAMLSESAPGMTVKDLRAGWIDGWLQSVMDSVGEQLSKSLEAEIVIDTGPAKVPQVRDQARIVTELVNAGVPLDEAKQIAGIG